MLPEACSIRSVLMCHIVCDVRLVIMHLEVSDVLMSGNGSRCGVRPKSTCLNITFPS